MNFLDMQNSVKAYSGEQNATRLKAAINNMYRQVLNKIKWPQNLIQPTTPITLAEGTQSYSLASDFKWIKQVWVVDPNNGEPIYLTKKRRILNNVNNGTSHFYRIFANIGTATARPAWKVALEEIPNAVFVAKYTSLYYEYYYQPDDLSGATDIPHVSLGADQVIVFGASVLLNAKQDDTQGFKMIGEMYVNGLADMIQRAIEVWGDEVIVAPGYEVTEHAGNIIDDYGIQKFKTG